jgi:hypothetical protein
VTSAFKYSIRVYEWFVSFGDDSLQEVCVPVFMYHDSFGDDYFQRKLYILLVNILLCVLLK